MSIVAPIGTVMPFHGDAPLPHGWMRLDQRGKRKKGRRLDKNKHWRLYRVMGPSYGGKSTNRFVLPYMPGNGWVDYIIRVR